MPEAYPSRFVEFALEEDDPEFCPIREITIREGEKDRTILVPCLRDKIKALHAYRQVMESLQAHWSTNLYWGVPGCRRAVRRLRRAYTGPGSLYVFKSDIADFFPTLDHGVVLEKFKRYGPAPLLPLIEDFLNLRVIQPDGSIRRWERGIPPGSPLSVAICFLVLFDLDTAMERWNGRVSYQRVADDLLLFSDDRKALEEAVEEMLAGVAELRLEVNRAKTGTFTRSDEFVYLGYRFADGALSLTPRNLARARRRIDSWTRVERFRTQREAGRTRAIVRSIAKVADRGTFQWLRFFSLVTDPSAFRRLDQHLGRRIRIAVSGSRRGRITDRDLRAIERHEPLGFYRTYMRMTHGRRH